MSLIKRHIPCTVKGWIGGWKKRPVIAFAIEKPEVDHHPAP
jgi:hypothetical protein